MYSQEQLAELDERQLKNVKGWIRRDKLEKNLKELTIDGQRAQLAEGKQIWEIRCHYEPFNEETDSDDDEFVDQDVDKEDDKAKEPQESFRQLIELEKKKLAKLRSKDHEEEEETRMNENDLDEIEFNLHVMEPKRNETDDIEKTQWLQNFCFPDQVPQTSEEQQDESKSQLKVA